MEILLGRSKKHVLGLIIELIIRCLGILRRIFGEMINEILDEISDAETVEKIIEILDSYGIVYVKFAIPPYISSGPEKIVIRFIYEDLVCSVSKKNWYGRLVFYCYIDEFIDDFSRNLSYERNKIDHLKQQIILLSSDLIVSESLIELYNLKRFQND